MLLIRQRLELMEDHIGNIVDPPAMEKARLMPLFPCRYRHRRAVRLAPPAMPAAMPAHHNPGEPDRRPTMT
jgi:hypothetical protein